MRSFQTDKQTLTDRVTEDMKSEQKFDVNNKYGVR